MAGGKPKTGADYNYSTSRESLYEPLKTGVRRSLEFIFDGLILVSGLPMATYEFYKTRTKKEDKNNR